jgi:hypothetical protein
VLEIVIADGPANAAEVTFMERLFKAIGRDQNELHAVLHRNADGLVLVQAGKREAGVGIKHEEAEIPAKMAEPDVQEVVIDFERLSRIRAETETVSAILSDIFKDEGISMPENDLGSDVSGSTAASESSPGGDSLFVGLDQEHGDLLSKVLKGRLLREEFDRVCAELGLMSDGALETLNEWGFDNIGEAIMDDGDGVEIFSDFLDDVRSRRVGE